MLNERPFKKRKVNALTIEWERIEELLSDISVLRKLKERELQSFRIAFKLNKENIQLIMPVLLQQKKLKELKVEGRWVRNSWSDFGTLLNQLLELSSLNMYFTNVGIDGTTELCSAFAKLTQLKRLNLGWNNIGYKGTSILAFRVLQKLTKLVELDLSNNNIGDEGAKTLTVALSKMPNLKLLILSNNNIGDRGAKALSLVFPKLNALSELSLRYNKISDAYAKIMEVKINNLQLLDKSLGLYFVKQ